jgi:hypothetical protein
MRMRENIIKTMEKSKKEDKIITVYSDIDDYTNYECGFFYLKSENEFVLKSVTETGLYDGYLVIELDDVYRVDYDGQYERKLEKLYNLNRSRHSKRVKENIFSEQNLFIDVMEMAESNNLYISLIFDNDEEEIVSGIVEEFTDEYVKLKVINEYGEFDGYTTVDIDEILKLSCDGEDEQVIKKLHES